MKQTKHFDSDWIHNYPQRYPKRKKFVKLIRSEIKHRAALKLAREEKEAAELLEQMKKEGLEISSTNLEGGGGGNDGNNDGRPLVDLNSKLELSKKNYILRKRLIYQPEVDAASSLVGKRIELLEGKAWRRSVIAAVKIDWIQDGLVPKASHKIVPVDEREKKNGPSSWEDLGRRRWYERQEVKVKEVDEEAAARWKANELRRAEIEQEKIEEEKREIDKLNRREEWVNGLRKDEEDRKIASLSSARLIFEKFANKVAKASIGKAAIHLKMIRITGDYRVNTCLVFLMLEINKYMNISLSLFLFVFIELLFFTVPPPLIYQYSNSKPHTPCSKLPI